MSFLFKRSKDRDDTIDPRTSLGDDPYRYSMRPVYSDQEPSSNRRSPDVQNGYQQGDLSSTDMEWRPRRKPSSESSKALRSVKFKSPETTLQQLSVGNGSGPGLAEAEKPKKVVYGHYKLKRKIMKPVADPANNSSTLSSPRKADSSVRQEERKRNSNDLRHKKELQRCQTDIAGLEKQLRRIVEENNQLETETRSAAEAADQTRSEIISASREHEKDLLSVMQTMLKSQLKEILSSVEERFLSMRNSLASSKSQGVGPKDDSGQFFAVETRSSTNQDPRIAPVDEGDRSAVAEAHSPSQKISQKV